MTTQTRIAARAVARGFYDSGGTFFHIEEGSPRPPLAAFGEDSHVTRVAWEDALYYYRAEIAGLHEGSLYVDHGYLVTEAGQEIARLAAVGIDRTSKAELERFIAELSC